MGISSFMDACRYELLPLVKFFGRRIVGCIVTILQMMINFRGPRKRVSELSSREGCVITSRVLWRWKNHIGDQSTPEDFLLWTYRPLSSLDILLKQDVSLYCMTPELAVFVRTSPDKNCYRSDTSPFFYMAQLFHAEQVYITSHRWLDLLTSEIAEECRVPVTWVSNVGRCGSTLLCQIMERVPGTVVISEPEATFNITHMARARRITPEQRLSMLRSTIIILSYHAKAQGLASVPQMHAEHIVIKARLECAPLVRDLFKVCPQVRHVFMYRRMPPFLKSLTQLMTKIKRSWAKAANSDAIARMTTWFRHCAFRQLFFASEEETASLADLIPTLTFAEMLAVMFCSQVKMVQTLQAEGCSIPALLYEDVLADPVATVGRLFDHLHVSRDHLDTALMAMNKESHSAVPGNLTSQQVSKRIISEREWWKVDCILVRYQLPKTGEDIEFAQRL